MPWMFLFAAAALGFFTAPLVAERIVRRRLWAQRDDAEKRRTALHEAGHAVAAWESPIVARILDATLTPRRPGLLGEVRFERPARAQDDETALRELIRLRLSGFAAEKAVFGAISEEWLLQEDALRAIACLIAIDRGTGGEGEHVAFAQILMTATAVGPEPLVRRFLELRQMLLAALAIEFVATSLFIEPRLARIKRVAEALYRRRTLRTRDLERLLGPRPVR